MSDGATPEGQAEKPARPKPSLLMIMGLANTVVALAAMGTFVYTRLLFKRPAITEAGERQKIEAMKKRLANSEDTEEGSITFETVTVNLKPSLSGLEAPGPQGLSQGKIHYATVAFTMELKDVRKKAILEEYKPVLMDRFLSLMGRKTYSELNTVQGRYVLRSQLLDLANQLISAESEDGMGSVTQVFFNTFMVQ